MGFQVLAMNPSPRKRGNVAATRRSSNPKKRKGTRRKTRRRRNPAISWALVGMAILGGAAIGAVSYAVEGLDISKAAQGGIQAAVGVGVGIAASKVNTGLGAGLAGGGTAVGLKNLGEAVLMAMAKPANGNATTTAEQDVSAVRARMGAVRRAKQLPVSDMRAVINTMRAIRARVS